MFGYVTANISELSEAEKHRYQAVYCGICRKIRQLSGQKARLCLSYDITFLALLLMSLYEPEESGGANACKLHPIKKRPWTDSKIISYCADMNVALAYYNAQDDWQDDHSLSAKFLIHALQPHYPAVKQRYPRQCEAIERCIHTLSRLERAHCSNPDEPANCFGQLMAELLVYEEDLWAPTLREMGKALGRFIYLADAMVDFSRDARKNRYNPYVVAGIHHRNQQEEHLIMAMSRCTAYFEILPLVQDKPLLDNILYSGVWTKFPKNKKEADQ